MQCEALEHDTALSWSLELALGLVTSVQAVPFQDSIRVWKPPEVPYEPTAKQAVAPGQAIPLSTLTVSPWLRLGDSDQAVPFQDRAVVWVDGPVAASPAAMQLDALAQDTPAACSPALNPGWAWPSRPSRSTRRPGSAEPALPTAAQLAALAHDTPRNSLTEGSGSGLVTTFQVLPFHDSARVLVSVPVKSSPTATHAVVVAQDTPFSSLSWVLGLGLVTTFQVLPFQDSTRVSGTEPKYRPTAVQWLALTQDTPFRKLPEPLAGLVTVAQVVPFQRSARVTSALPLSSKPTATQKVALTQDTPSRLFTELLGLGLDAMDQVEPFQVSISVRAALLASK